MFPILFCGCEKYSEITIPNFNGTWYFYDYEIHIEKSVSEVKIIKNDTICVNSFSNQTLTPDGILLKQDYNNTAEDRRFIVNKTIWDIGSSSHVLNIFNPNSEIMKDKFWVSTDPMLEMLHIQNLTNGSTTAYTYTTNPTTGKSYITRLDILSPSFVTDIYLSNGKREKGVIVSVLLRFRRN